MPTNDTCLLCLDKLNNNVSSPKYCDCKIYMHTNCMKLIENSGLACPICRIKMIKKNDTIYEFYEVHFLLFTLYPNFLTFIIMISCNFMITIFFIIPYLIIIVLAQTINSRIERSLILLKNLGRQSIYENI